MVQALVKIKEIETDSTGQMITVIYEVTINGETYEDRYTEMIFNVANMKKAELMEHFNRLLKSIIKQKIKEKNAIDVDMKWKDKALVINEEMLIDITEYDEEFDYIQDASDIPLSQFFRDYDDPTKIWQMVIINGVVQLIASSVEEWLLQ